MNTTQWLKSFRQRFARISGADVKRRNTRRKQATHNNVPEALESRMLLSGINCLGQIQGVAFQDLSGDGVLDAGDPRLSNAADGVVVHLFEAGLDGVFDSAGTGGVAVNDDVFISTAAPAMDGSYDFSGLAAGTYFTEQPTPAGFIQRAGATVSGPITFSLAEAAGTAGQLIDAFDEPTPAQSLTADDGSPIASSSVSGLTNVLGGERDLYVERTGGTLDIDLEANSPPGFLNYNANFFTTGLGRVTWDGIDGVSAVATTGLASDDLTNGGTDAGFVLEIGGNTNNATLTVTLYTGAGVVAETAAIPNTGAASTQSLFLPFADFVGADLTDVGAVEMTINAPDAATTVLVSEFRTQSVTTKTANFANYLPMTLGGTIFNDANNSSTFQSGTESIFSGVALTLFEDDGNGVFDGTETQIGTTSSVAGDYAFTNLFPGDYIVRVDASNFAAAGALEGRESSTGAAATDPDDDVNNDDNGTHLGTTTTAVVSQAITLINSSETAVDGDADTNTNFSLDFGFFGRTNIAVDKNGPATVIAGSGPGNLVYTIDVTNTSGIDATGVTMTDAMLLSLPAGVTFVSTSLPGEFNQGTAVWTIGDLAAGATEQITVTLTVAATASESLQLSNTAIVAANEQETNPNDNEDTVVTDIDRRINITVDKNGPATVIAGSSAGNLVYTIDVTNDGPSDATGVTMTDDLLLNLPAGVSFVSTSLPAEFNTGTAVWNIGNLAAGASEQITVTLTVNQTASDSLQVTNVSVVAANETETDLTDNDDTVVTDIDRRINITVDKNGPATVIAGSGAGNLVYTIDVTNDGPSDATGVIMTDALLLNLPTGVSFVSTSLPAEFNTGTAVWNIGNLAAGASEQITVTLTVDQTASDSLLVTNVSVVAANETETNPNDNSDSVVTDVDRQINITVDKNGPATVIAGSSAGNLVYTIDVTNDGPSNATGVIMTDDLLLNLPAGVAFVSTSLPAEFNTGSAVWNIGDLPAGESEQITITLTVDQTASDSLLVTNVSVVAANETETNPNDNSDSVVTDVDRRVNITVDKSGPATVVGGSGAGNLVYTIDVRNDGPSNATGVTMTDARLLALPTGVTFVSTSLPAEFNTGTAVWNIGDLAAGAMETITVTLTVDGTAVNNSQITNISVVDVTETETSTADNSDTVVTTINGEVNITVDKNGPATVIAGSGIGNLVYTIDVTNAGPSAATGVTMTDALLLNLPGGVSFVSTDRPAEFNTATSVWNIGNLGIGATERITVTLTVDATAADTLQLTNVSVVAANEPESNLNDNDDTVVTDIDRQINLTVDKNGPASVIAGSAPGNLTYTIDVTNDGPSNATGVTMTDALLTNLPPGVSFVSTSLPAEFNTGTAVWNVGDLASGATERLTVTLTVGANAADALSITNVSVVAANETETTLVDNQDSVVTDIDRLINLSVDKNGPATVIAGSTPGNLVYTIDVTNDGPSNATGVTMSDALLTNLPSGVSFVSTSLPAEFNTATGVWTIGDLATGATERLTVNLTVDATAPDSLNLTNVSVVAANETEVTLADNTDSVVTAVDRRVNLTVDKNGPATVIAGSSSGNLVYTIDVTNAGPSNATGVTMSDALLLNLPAGVSLVSTSLPGEFNTGSAVWNIGNLAAGATERISVTLTVDASASASLNLTNVSVVAANEQETNINDNTDSVVTNIDRLINLTVDKSGPASIQAGSGPGNLVYTIDVTNAGPSNATGVTMSDALLLSLPAGITFVSTDRPAEFNSSTAVWNIGDLASGATERITITATAAATTSIPQLTNVSVVAANEPESIVTDNTDTVVTTVDRQVNIQIGKNAPSTVVAGSGNGNLVYTVTATNTGPSAATGVSVRDQLLTSLPAGILIDSATDAGGGSYNSGTGIWTVGSLAENEVRTLTVVLTVDGTVTLPSLTNLATLNSVDQVDSNPTDNSSSTVTTIERVVDLVVEKNDLVDPIRSPGVIQYEIIVTNNGPSTATNVVLTDVLSPQVTFVSVAETHGTSQNASGIVITEIGTLASGETATITLVVNANIPNGGTVTNVVTVNANEAVTPSMDSEPTLVLPGFGAISGVVYEDLNNNGLQSAGEPGIPGTTILLFGVEDGSGANVVRRQVTDALGAYLFSELAPGTYNVVELQPGIFTEGRDSEDGTVLNNSDQTDVISNIQVAAQQVRPLRNFGEGVRDESKRDFLASNQIVGQNVQPTLPLQVTGNSTIRGFVAVDSNGNGVFDAGDAGIPAAIVTLIGTDNLGNAVLISQATDTDGSYSFTGLPAGTYSVSETQPAAYLDGPEQSPTTGNVLPDSVLDDLFSLIALPESAVGNGFNFLERVSNGATVPANQAPVLAAQSVQGTSQPVLTWQPVAGAAAYDVWINQMSGGGGLVYRNQNVVGTSLKVPVNLMAGEHMLWVRAIMANGTGGPWSQPQKMNISPAPAMLSPNSATADTTPMFDFSDVTGAESYDLMVQDMFGKEVIDVEQLTTSQYSGTTELPLGTYRAFTRARTAGVAGSWSEGTEFSVNGAPQLVNPVSASALAPALLEWSDSGAAEYEVWVNETTGGTRRVVTVEKTTGTAILLSNEPVGNYRFWVRGFDADGVATSWSAPQTFEISSAGQVLSPAGNTSGINPTITWKPVAGATHYDVWVADNSGMVARELHATGTSHTFNQTLAEGGYRVWVKPIGLNGSGTWSTASRFTVGGLSSPTVNSLGTTTSDRTPEIRWNSVAGATRYELWVNHEGVTNRVIHETNLTGTSFTPTSGLAAGNYRIWVRAIGSNGIESSWSAAVRVAIT